MAEARKRKKATKSGSKAKGKRSTGKESRGRAAKKAKPPVKKNKRKAEKPKAKKTAKPRAKTPTARFDPLIVAFVCNWCAYAGADYAGVSRIQYPPNVRLIRVMCSGRVEPAFILKAFEEGADGVLVGGCHEADCHYISGNLKARDRVEATGKILDLLGLGSDRLRLKWINANEGAAFAEEIAGFVDLLKRLGPNPIKPDPGNKESEETDPEAMHRIMKETDAYLCVECGKCTASCPVARREPNFSPRLTVEKSLEGMYAEIETEPELWSCLTCRTCEQRCPHDVRFSDFTRLSRVEARKLSRTGRQTQAGAVLSWMRIMSMDSLKQDRLSWVPDNLKFKKKATKKSDIMFFVGCLPHYQISHSHIDSNSLNIATDTLAVLNAVGIQPVLLSNECCCGHDLLWNGDTESFERLAQKNWKAIKAAGVKNIVLSCPEGYQTLKEQYPRVLKGWDVQVQHISELLADRLDAGKLKFKNNLDLKVTYQDPCRLGRYLGIYEAPRKLLSGLPGVELVEMPHYAQDAICCGVSGWVNCGATAKSIQMDRLKEARSTGASVLVTACPKCQIHFRCALSGKVPGEKSDVEITLEDLTALTARALGVGGGA